MSDNLNGWIRASERFPCDEETDERGMVWFMSPSGTAILKSAADVRINWLWHPKPKAVPPAPPKIEERKRRQLWARYYYDGPVARETEDRLINETNGTECPVEFREVMPDDPTLEDLSALIESCDSQIAGHPHMDGGTREVIKGVRWALNLLARE